MIWNSTWLMTAIDLVIAVSAAIALRDFVSNRAEIRQAGAQGGVLAVAVGLCLVAGFYLSDAWTMWALPLFMSESEAMATMRWLHLNLGFVVSAVSVPLIVLGSLRVMRANRQLLVGVRAGQSALGEELRQRARDNEALETARRKFDAAFSAGGVGMFTTDGEGRFTEVNGTLCRIFGYDEPELLGRTRDDLTHPDDLAATAAPNEWTPPGETGPGDVEKRFVRKDGTVIWTLTNATRIRKPDGSLDYVVGTILDISDRKNAADALRSSEQRLALALEASNDGIWDWDVRTDRDYFSPRWKAIIGYGPDELEPRVETFAELVHPEDRERTWQAVDGHLKERLPYDLEIRLLHKQGHYVWVRARGQAEWDEDGAPLRMAGSITDIQERKRIEERLRESEARYRRSIEEAEFGIRIEQPGGKRLFINRKCVEMFGFDFEAEYREAIAAPGTLVAPHDRARMIANLQARESGKEALDHYEYDAIRKDGSLMPVEVFVRPIVWEGELAYQRTLVDISDRRSAERRLRELNAELEARVEARTAELQAAQAELIRQERLATLGQLAATVSHEIRNPIGTIATAADVIDARIAGGDPGVRPALDRVRRSVARCDRIISEMLDYARETSPDFAETNLDSWLSGVLDEQPDVEGIDVRRELGAGDAMVKIDEDTMRRAVINVYQNAIDAMASPASDGTADGGPLVIATSARDGHAEIVFTDSGPGIPAADLERIFEPLFSTKSFGVGLGLPVVRKVVEQHNGTIDIASRPGRGTTVSLRIPLIRAA